MPLHLEPMVVEDGLHKARPTRRADVREFVGILDERGADAV